MNLPIHKRSLHPLMSRHHPVWWWVRVAAVLLVLFLGVWLYVEIGTLKADREGLKVDREALLGCVNGQNLRTDDGDYVHCSINVIKVGEL